MRVPICRRLGLVSSGLLAAILTGCLTPKPRLAPPAGTYDCPETVTITDSRANAAIYYTTDGSAPTQASSKYQGPFVVNSNAKVQAIAVAPGRKSSADVGVQYSCTPNLSHAAFALNCSSTSNCSHRRSRCSLPTCTRGTRSTRRRKHWRHT